MATAWPDVFPLTDKTKFKFLGNTVVDRMSDGTVKSRQMTTAIPVNLSVDLAPMEEPVSLYFNAYINASNATEFAIPHNGRTYTGYIQQGSLDCSVQYGNMYYWTFNLLGVCT